MNIIGIDVSKEKLDCAWLREQDKLKTKAVVNKLLGWQDLLDWSLKNKGLAIAELHFVMEATGIYHEQLATFLYEAGANVSVVNPAQVKFYAQGLGVRSKNDKKDSVVLAPVQHESGNSVKGRAHLSKAGNPIIRAKLYMAAVVAIRYNPDIKAQYERLTSKGKSKMPHSARLCVNWYRFASVS